jgi:hypothetical protein
MKVSIGISVLHTRGNHTYLRLFWQLPLQLPPGVLHATAAPACAVAGKDCCQAAGPSLLTAVPLPSQVGEKMPAAAPASQINSTSYQTTKNDARQWQGTAQVSIHKPQQEQGKLCNNHKLMCQCQQQPGWLA